MVPRPRSGTATGFSMDCHTRAMCRASSTTRMFSIRPASIIRPTTPHTTSSLTWLPSSRTAGSRHCRLVPRTARMPCGNSTFGYLVMAGGMTSRPSSTVRGRSPMRSWPRPSTGSRGWPMPVRSRRICPLSSTSMPSSSSMRAKPRCSVPANGIALNSIRTLAIVSDSGGGRSSRIPRPIRKSI